MSYGLAFVALFGAAFCLGVSLGLNIHRTLFRLTSNFEHSVANVLLATAFGLLALVAWWAIRSLTGDRS